VTSTDPNVTAPSFSNYPLCGAHPGSVGAGVTVKITCKPGLVGRYVIVQLKGSNFLTLCEVQVFTGTGTSNQM